MLVNSPAPWSIWVCIIHLFILQVYTYTKNSQFSMELFSRSDFPHRIPVGRNLMLKLLSSFIYRIQLYTIFLLVIVTKKINLKQDPARIVVTMTICVLLCVCLFCFRTIILAKPLVVLPDLADNSTTIRL